MQGKMAAPAGQAGWFETIKRVLSPEALMERFNLSREQLVNMGLYLAAGFLTGFLLKKYSRYVITIVMCVIGLALLQNFNVITITVNWARLQEIGLGAVPTTVDATIVAVYWEWIKMHVGVVLSFSLGFLVGLKVG